MSHRLLKRVRAVTCALLDHSRYVTTFWGYVYCARCKAQIGDTFAGVTDLRGHVIVGHDCDQCKKNEKRMTWKDRIFTNRVTP